MYFLLDLIIRQKLRSAGAWRVNSTADSIVQQYNSSCGGWTESPLGIKVSMPTSVKRLHGTTVRPRAPLCRLAGFPLHSFTTASTAEGSTEIKKIHHKITAQRLSLPSNNHLILTCLLSFIFYITAAFLTSCSLLYTRVVVQFFCSELLYKI